MQVLPFKKKTKDLESFESLLESHLDGMYRVALSLTRNPIHAEDLVHDTAVRALRFKDRFEMGTNFKAWIYTVLHHTFVHRYRRQKRERELLEGATRHDVDRQLHSEKSRTAARDPENSYLEHMLSDDVVRALEALPEDFRAVVTLCDLEGLSYKEIADVLGRPVGTVMSRLYRGRRHLEKRLRALAIERGILKPELAAPLEAGAAVDLEAGVDSALEAGAEAEDSEADGSVADHREAASGALVNFNRYRRRRA